MERKGVVIKIKITKQAISLVYLDVSIAYASANGTVHLKWVMVTKFDSMVIYVQTCDQSTIFARARLI